MNTSFLTFLTNLTNPNLACNINLLKTNFENSISLGGENTHLDSKLEDPIPWLIGPFRLATVVVVLAGSKP